MYFPFCADGRKYFKTAFTNGMIVRRSGDLRGPTIKMENSFLTLCGMTQPSIMLDVLLEAIHPRDGSSDR